MRGDVLLRNSDFSLAFRADPASTGADFYCAALDESDLTLTGHAESSSFSGGVEFAASTAYVYASRTNATASWRLGTSAAGQQCLRKGLQNEIQGTSVRLVSFRKLSFPAVAQRSVLYRVVAEQQGAFAPTWTSSPCRTRERRCPSSTGRVSHLRPQPRSAGLPR
jgi:hypothetical protein